jgi:TonB family protein
VDGPAGAGWGNTPGVGSVGEGDSVDGMVQERVRQVADILGAAAARRARRGGVAKVQFWVDRRGYVRGETVQTSSGSARLDEEIPAILHLAEPYPGGPRAFTVDVTFRAVLYAPVTERMPGRK